MKVKPKKVKDFKDVELPEEIIRKYDQIDLERLKDSVTYDYIDIFCNRLLSRVNNDYLTCFYNNINELKVEFRDFENSHVKGEYHGNNTIYVGNNFEEIIFHELTHMASSKVQRRVICTGFLQQNKNHMIGIGLDEGYTQLETERNFSDYKVLPAYELLVHYCKMLENVLGEETLKKYYYTANLYGLIDHMKSYTSINNIMQFINDMDLLKKQIYSEKHGVFQGVLYRNAVDTIYRLNDFMFRINMIKITRLEEFDLINKEESDKLKYAFLRKCVDALVISNKRYEIYGRDYENVFNNTFEEVIDQIEIEKVLNLSSK